MGRHGLVMLVAAALAACNPARLEVRMPLDEAVTRASLSVRATGEASHMRPDQLSIVRSAVTSALANHGVEVVAKGEPGVPSVEGQIEVFEDAPSWARWVPWPLGPWFFSGYFQSTWAVRSPAGRLVGGCQIKGRVLAEGYYKSGIEDMVAGTGERLGEFLLEAQ